MHFEMDSEAVVIATVPSKSNPSKVYHLTLGKNGHVYCDCPRWRFQKGKQPFERTCGHLEALRRGELKL